MGLYLLIWGEAANVRFMPECLCYIFHNVSTVSDTKTILPVIPNLPPLHLLSWAPNLVMKWSSKLVLFQMAYELHGLLAGNVSIVTGENIKPSYGGDDEAFLRKVITPLYRVIEKVCKHKHALVLSKFSLSFLDSDKWSLHSSIPGSQEEQKWKSSIFSLVQLWWSKRILLVCGAFKAKSSRP